MSAVKHINPTAPHPFVLLDGALGTELQQAGMPAGERPEAFMLRAPQTVTAIHKAYIKAGATVIYTNTFGATRKKLDGTGLTVPQVVNAAVRCAKEAAKGTNTKVALAIGPLGEMMEPSGTLRFEEAIDIFAECMQAGEAAGADLIVTETMSDLYELKAAVLAAKEHTDLPLWASMSFEEGGRTFTGVSVEAFATTIGGLGAAALGINCSLGPAAIMPLAERLCAATPLPVFVKPNAGMPDPISGAYNLPPDDFTAQMQRCKTMGVSAVGGCCGTSPQTIAALKESFGAVPTTPRRYQPTSRLCSDTRVVTIDGVYAVGERINPTGKKRLQQALAQGDMGYLQTLAVEQQQAGAAIIDVNVGTPGIDEVTALPQAVKAVQAVCDLPIQIDSSNTDAIEAALRVCNGKPSVNSTSGEKAKMDAILPLCRYYNAAVVGLTLDEDGIPATSDERLRIAETIVNEAARHGVPKEDVWIDALTLTVSAEPDAAAVTLQTVQAIRTKLGLQTMLGVSNISFGLPERPLVNRVFLTQAIEAGLTLPILNPQDTTMMQIITASEMLHGKAGATERYLAHFQKENGGKAPAKPTAEAGDMPLAEAVEKGLQTEAKAATRTLLDGGANALDIIETTLTPALDTVGERFEKEELFLPQLLASASAAQAAFEMIRATMDGGAQNGPVVVLATVEGDIHDIGKNITKMLLQNYGFNVVDLGRDVPPQQVVEAAEKSGAKLVGLSALMTTTLPAMEATIKALNKALPNCQTVVGGAVLTPSYADTINADYYAKTAQQGVAIAQQVYGL